MSWNFTFSLQCTRFNLPKLSGFGRFPNYLPEHLNIFPYMISCPTFSAYCNLSSFSRILLSHPYLHYPTPIQLIGFLPGEPLTSPYLVDPCGKVRELVLEGLVGVEHCTVADIETLAEVTAKHFAFLSKGSYREGGSDYPHPSASCGLWGLNVNNDDI